MVITEIQIIILKKGIEAMDITLIFPAVGRKKGSSYIKSWQMEPLSIAILAGLTPKHINLHFFDDRIESIPYDRPTDAVALSVETYSAKRAYEIAKEYRQRGVLVIMGGYHPTLVPGEVSQYADAVVIGEAEDCWLKVLDDLQKKKLQKEYRSSGNFSLDKATPDRSIFKGKHYFDLTLVETGRGCHFQCNFCSVTAFHRATYRRRPVGEIVSEIKQTGKKRIFFVDDNIISDFDSAQELFEALIPLEISWISQCSIDVTKNEQLLSLMKQSGCSGLLVGFESIHKENLTQMGKFHNSQNIDYARVISKFREKGIVIYGTFVFGYDHDNEETFRKSVLLAKKSKLFIVAFNHLVPFPGTPLYKRLEAEGKLLYQKWWLSPEYFFGDVAFKPAQLSAVQLSDLCISSRRDFYGMLSILSRGFDFKANCLNLSRAIAFLLTNLMLRKEIDQRKGLPLGNG
jgi:radical SAM superfamily enzyme YgiQ (UPF0313 family)